MRGWPGRHRVEAALRGETKRVHDAHAGDYEGAMEVVRQSLAELHAARARRDEIVVPAVLRAAHERIDDALARAAAAATAVYNALFEAAGGTYHAESDPDVALWKRHMNTALTLRSQHQLSQLDDEGALRGVPLVGTAGAHARTRAAFGPHQAGVDFDVHLDASTSA
jgi:hypothetical protein